MTFRKLIEQRIASWDAVRGQRTRIPGTAMALGRGDLPHDLKQMIVEGSVGIGDGFWGSVASGATFKSTGRKRTRSGRAVIAANRQSILAAEAVVAEHVYRWEHGHPTPAGEHFDQLARAWSALGDGDELTVEWPSLRVLSFG